MFSLRTGGVRLLRRWVTAFADAAIVILGSSGAASAGFSGLLGQRQQDLSIGFVRGNDDKH